MDDRRKVLLGARSDLRFILGLLILALMAGLSACGQTSSAVTPTRYVTEYGLGPDKWASAWLLIRHADPSAQLSVAQPGTPLEQGISFDLPSSALKRTGNQSTFEMIRDKFQIKDPIVATLAAIVYDIEVNYWAPSDKPGVNPVGPSPDVTVSKRWIDETPGLLDF